ncbi:Lactonase, 7-bladed beta-propeller-domain-containing protein [Nemania sp. NC0429]|nr:Lactonase, 7-bladed beta-propeller-domain-containing protein [Nemania sp. NC0429]
MFRTLTTLIALGSMATAAPSAMRRDAAPETHNLIVGGPGQIAVAKFDGKAFTITGQHAEPGASPSWMRYKHSANSLYAVNENAANLDVLDLKLDGPTLTGSVNGSTGVVFLEFNKDQTRLVGAGYGSGKIDLWDTSAAGAPKLLKSLDVTGPTGPNQQGHHPHQAILDPTGNFVVVPDLGGDQLLVVRIQGDELKIMNTVSMAPGTTPRHGSFIGGAGKLFFLAACEETNIVVLYEVSYNDANGMIFNYISEQSTYGKDGPKNATSAAAGAILVAANQRDVYVSNRNSGAETDNVAHFVFAADKAELTFQETVSTTGIGPRSMAFSANKDQNVLFVANMGGKNGLIALARDGATGKLTPEPVGAMAYAELVSKDYTTTPNAGPQFVTAFIVDKK